MTRNLKTCLLFRLDVLRWQNICSFKRELFILLCLLNFWGIIFNVIFLSKILLFFWHLMQISWAFDVMIYIKSTIKSFTGNRPIDFLSKSTNLLFHWKLFFLVIITTQVSIGLYLIAIFFPYWVTFGIMRTFQHSVTFYIQPFIGIMWI